MTWISVRDIRKPHAYKDILLTDGVCQWVGYTFDDLDIFLASHPDYKREPKNEYGAPFITYARPTHWMPLPHMPTKDE